jgi:mannose-1-phosphate guanylyltransferase/mannose-6-phosphate isomerase
VGRNTAPAIGLTAIYLHHLSPEPIMIVIPSDHAIPEREKFLSDLRLAIQGARKDHLVTFGIKPTRPETGYGYIKVDDSAKIGLTGLCKVERFFEKPDLQTAKNYLSDENYFWNSGIFVWKTSKILSEIKNHLPALYKILKEMEVIIFPSDERINASTPQRDQQSDSTDIPNLRRNRLTNLYSSIESLSIDYGIMEKSSNTLMVPATFQWSDLGNWTALDEIIEKNKDGNILRGNTIDIGSQGSTIFAGERLIATIGLRDMVVVDTPDATLITPKERVQEVRKIVEVLKRNSREEHLVHKTVERPWGSYTFLEKGQGYKIKRVVLKPGTKLSLQIHKRRSEHWVVAAGTAKVTRDDETYFVHPNESTYIPINTRHRLENPGDLPLQIIEVQNGDYVEEDDIERFDDDYGRM